MESVTTSVVELWINFPVEAKLDEVFNTRIKHFRISFELSSELQASAFVYLPRLWRQCGGSC